MLLCPFLLFSCLGLNKNTAHVLKFKDPDWGINKVYVNSSLNGKRTLGHLLLPRTLNFCSLPMHCHWTPSLCDLCLHGLRDSGLCLSTTGLGSDPYIHMDGSVESGLQLVCTAKGWFPEPQISWQDIRGEKLLTISKHSIQDEDGLFYVESTLVVRNVSTEIVSCFIHSPTLTEERGSDISIPGQCSASRTKML